VPLEDSFGALAELRAEGLVRHLGLSSAKEAELDRARRIAPVAAVQNHFNLADRSGEVMLEMCDREGIAFVPYFPLARGELARSAALDAIARAHDATAAQIAHAWLLGRSATTLVIPGTASMAHLEENVAAAGVRLEQSELGALDRPSPAGECS
jgi:pyridoxine 4-dehydrogenase